MHAVELPQEFPELDGSARHRLLRANARAASRACPARRRGEAERHARALKRESASGYSTSYGRLRFRLRVFAGGAARPAVQKLTMSCVALVIALVAWRLACAVARLRSEPAAAFIPLSHMLMN